MSATLIKQVLVSQLNVNEFKQSINADDTRQTLLYTDVTRTSAVKKSARVKDRFFFIWIQGLQKHSWRWKYLRMKLISVRQFVKILYFSVSCFWAEICGTWFHTIQNLKISKMIQKHVKRFNSGTTKIICYFFHFFVFTTMILNRVSGITNIMVCFETIQKKPYFPRMGEKRNTNRGILK